MAGTDQAEPQVVQKKPAMDQKQEQTWAMLCHLGGLLGIIPPLVIWLVKKDESSLVNDNGKEAINFMITLAIGYIICIPLLFVIIGFFLMMALGIYALVMLIIAALKANEGQSYRYPICLRLIK